MPQFPAASAHLAGGAPARRTGAFLNGLKADRYLYLLAAPGVSQVYVVELPGGEAV